MIQSLWIQAGSDRPQHETKLLRSLQRKHLIQIVRLHQELGPRLQALTPLAMMIFMARPLLENPVPLLLLLCLSI